MPALSHQVIEEFCMLCDWSFQVWLNHRALFDDNPRAQELQKSMAADALARLQIISHEYSLLQIAKLHDKAVVAGEVTLGIEYVVKYGGWNEPILSQLQELAQQLDHFARGLRGARNKVLSHNDLAAILAQVTLGDFEKDEDVKYFNLLQKFVDIVHSEVIGDPRPFDDLAKNDVIAFMAMVRQ